MKVIEFTILIKYWDPKPSREIVNHLNIPQIRMVRRSISQKDAKLRFLSILIQQTLMEHI